MPSSTRVEARKLVNLGFVDVSWLQVIPVEDCIAVCAPGRHARQRSCRLGKRSRTDKTRWSAQKSEEKGPRISCVGLWSSGVAHVIC
jgi:hypothetical protein